MQAYFSSEIKPECLLKKRVALESHVHLQVQPDDRAEEPRAQFQVRAEARTQGEAQVHVFPHARDEVGAWLKGDGVALDSARAFRYADADVRVAQKRLKRSCDCDGCHHGFSLLCAVDEASQRTRRSGGGHHGKFAPWYDDELEDHRNRNLHNEWALGHDGCVAGGSQCGLRRGLALLQRNDVEDLHVGGYRALHHMLASSGNGLHIHR